MKKVNIKRFQQKNPEDISFKGASIPEKPIATTENVPLQNEKGGKKRTNEPMSERTNERTVNKNTSVAPEKTAVDNIASGNFYTAEIPAERVKTRHSFDIFQDQKNALEKLQMALKDSGQKKKPVLGDMAQEAFDLYIKEKSKKLNNFKIIRERPNERTNERSETSGDIIN